MAATLKELAQLVQDQKKVIETLSEDRDKLIGKQSKLEKDFISLRKKHTPEETPEEKESIIENKNEPDLRVYRAAIIELLHNNELLNYSSEAQSEFLTFYINNKEDFSNEVFDTFKNTLLEKYKKVEKAKKDKMVEEEKEKTRLAEEEKKRNPEVLNPPDRPAPTNGITPDKKAKIEELTNIARDTSKTILERKKAMDEIYNLEVRKLLDI